jgi:DNA primase
MKKWPEPTMIKPHSIQKVLDTALIEEVIGEFVRLKRTGANLKGLSPFTSEKTPSFVVSPTKQLYKCFSSGKGGNVVSFLMEHEQLSFPEAIRWLAKKYQIELEETEQTAVENEAQKERESLFIVNEFAKKHFSNNLWDSEEGKTIGLSYFRERGLLESTIRKFDLGFALRSRKALVQAAKEGGFELKYLQELGLVNKGGYDFFHDRIMFTICDSNGRPIAFAGRVMGKSPEGVKYINSPESPVYHKTNTLYGLHLAKTAIRKQNECILVEGYLDLLSLFQAGVENVVASSGTALTEEQVKLIKRHTSNVCLLYDADPAGIKAAIRGADILLEQGVDVKICLLPEGQDPDDFIRQQGYQAFMDYKEQHARDIIQYRTAAILSETEHDPVKRTSMIQELLETLAKIPDAIKRSLYIQSCAPRLGVPEQVMVSELNKVLKRQVYMQQRRQFQEKSRESALDSPAGEPETQSKTDLPPVRESNPLLAPERDVLRVLMAYGNVPVEFEGHTMSTAEFILSNMQDVLESVELPVHRKVLEISLQALNSGILLESPFFIHHEDPEIASLAAEILLQPFEYSDNWEERYHLFLETQPRPEKNVDRDSLQAIMRYKFQKINQQCRANQDKIKELSQSAEKEIELLTLLKMQKKLIDYRNEIATQLGTVVW